MVADSIFLAIGFGVIIGSVWGAVISLGLYICLVILLKWVLSHLGIPVDKGFEATDDNDKMFYCIIIFVCFTLFALGAIVFVYDLKIWGAVMIGASLITSVTCPLPTSRRDGTGRPEISFGILVAFALIVMFIHSWQTTAAVLLVLAGLLFLGGKIQSMGCAANEKKCD